MEQKISLNNDTSLLPANIAELIVSPELSELMAKIAVKNNLSETPGSPNEEGARVIRELSAIVFRVLEGNLPSDLFDETLAKELSIDDVDKITAIAKDVEELIFRPVRNDLNNLYSERKKVEELFSSVENPIISVPKKEKKNKLGDTYREPVE